MGTEKENMEQVLFDPNEIFDDKNIEWLTEQAKRMSNISGMDLKQSAEFIQEIYLRGMQEGLNDH
jgi:hypothetical protein